MSLLSGVQAATTTATQAASTTAAAQNPNAMFNTIAMVAVFALFIYFLLWRPQSKRVKEHRDLLSSIKTGDEVVTAGGLMGKVDQIQENVVDLIIANNVQIKMQKSSIISVLPKGTIK